MSALRFRRPLLNCVKEYRYVSTGLPQEDQYSYTPQYPPILDISHEKVAAKKKEAEYEAIKAVKTVEEKQIKLNMSKYYGFKCYMLLEEYIPYNNLELIQHVTRTHLIRDENLPNFYNGIDVSSLLTAVKNDIEETILIEMDQCRQKVDLHKVQLNIGERENIVSSALSKQINRIIINSMSKHYSHIDSAQVDFNPRIESLWFAGGMDPPENIKRCKRGQEWRKNEVDAPTNRAMNYIGTASVALRSNKPLRPILSLSESENPDFIVPRFKLDPRTVGTANQFRHIANIPGFWPGDPNQFGLLSYHQRGHHLTRHYKDPEDNLRAIDRQGILSSFAWLNSQANFLGFTTFNDVTYPLLTQTIITNGQLWSFFVYQLNTVLIHSKHIEDNPQRNICWTTPVLKLYEGIVDGKLVGFNDQVLQNLLKFYANVPEERLGVEMRPYLSKEEKVCGDYQDDDQRQWLEREYKHLVSNRPRHALDYEIYAWEKIYKIDHETKFLDKKRRPFEYGIKPWNRKLDERLPRYIPRVHRPHLPRWKGRYAKEYFP